MGPKSTLGKIFWYKFWFILCYWMFDLVFHCYGIHWLRICWQASASDLKSSRVTSDPTHQPPRPWTSRCWKWIGTSEPKQKNLQATVVDESISAVSPRSFPLLILNRKCLWRTKMASSGSRVHLQFTGEAVVTWGSIRLRCQEDQSCPMNVNRIREVLTNWISGSGFPHGWHPNMDDGSTKNININNGSRN